MKPFGFAIIAESRIGVQQLRILRFFIVLDLIVKGIREDNFAYDAAR